MQEFQDFEVWVIGDGCTDDSSFVVESFNDQRLNWYNLPFNAGSQYAPNNEGLKRARGKYIAYLGHDDLWFPDHLKKLKYFLETKDLDFVHGLCICIKPSGANYIIGAPPNGRDYVNAHIPPSSWLHKKSAVDTYGFWINQDKIHIGVDREYLNRAAKMGASIGFVNDLFLIKFVSYHWGIYSKKVDYPQADFFHQLQLNPDGLLKKVLMDSANTYSAHFDERFSFKLSLQKFLDNTLFLLFNFYSRDRWPLNVLLTYWYQRARKVNRTIRGLSPKK